MAFTFDDFIHGVEESIVAAVLVSGFIYLIQCLRYFIFLRCRYNHRRFDIYFKGDYKNGKGKPTGHAVCRVPLFSKKIKFAGRIETTGEGDFTGEFLMNPLRLKLGRGFQYHSNFDGFNFPQLLIKDRNTFFIQTNFVALKEGTNGHFENYHKGYIWMRKEK